MVKSKKNKEDLNREGIVTIRVELGREWWRVVRVYVNKNVERKLEELREWIEERENEGVNKRRF